MAAWPSKPGTGQGWMDEPSSTNIAGTSPCSRRKSTMRVLPPVSSSWLAAMYTSHSGVYPASMSSSTAWKMSWRLPFTSRAPRPHNFPSAMVPEKGGYFHAPGASTTSWWLMSTRALRVFPGQQKSRLLSNSHRRQPSNTRGKSSAITAWRRSKFSLSAPGRRTGSTWIMRAICRA